MTIRYRITATVTPRRGPFTEPGFRPPVDEAKARLWQWIHGVRLGLRGLARPVLRWRSPLNYGCVNHRVTQLALRGNKPGQMQQFIPGIVE